MITSTLDKIGKYRDRVSVLALMAVIVAPSNALAQLSPGEPPTDDDRGLLELFAQIGNILLMLIGAVAVIMLIVGGFRYVASAGDSSAIEGAKNTILYAIIGIVVAFLAYAAINFLTEQLAP